MSGSRKAASEIIMSGSRKAASVFIVFFIINGLRNIEGTEDHTGSKFTLVLMENGIYDGSASIFLKMINHASTGLSYQVSNLIGHSLGTSTITDNTAILSSSDFRLTTTGSVMNGTEKSNKAIYINVENSPLPANLPSAYLVFNNIGASDSTLLLPDTALGTAYYAITYCELFGYCQIAVARDSSTTTTSVTIRLPSRSDVHVIFESVTYTAGGVITTQLEHKDAIQIQCQCDLSGTFIESTTAKIAVFSGSYEVVVGVGGKRDFLLEQMLPVSKWGKEYIAYSMTLRNTGDFIRVIASQANTVVRLSGYITVKLSKAGDFIHRRIDSGNAVYIRADKPVMVVQFTLNTETNDGLNGDSSMFIVQATDHYLNGYTFFTLNTSGKTYIASVMPKNSEGLYLDGVLLNDTDTCCLATNIVPEESVVVGYKNVSSGRHTLTSASNEFFGVYLLEEENGKIYSQIIGFSIPEVPTTKLMIPGDNIDNDNNMQVDEDLVCSETDILSAMSQQDSNKDCGKVLGTSSNSGKLFMLVFPGSGGEAVSIMKFYVSFASSTSFDYTEFPSGTTNRMSVNLKKETQVNNLNNEMELVETGVHDRMVFIESNDNIVVHAQYVGDQSAYSYLALPVNAFGLEYFAVTHYAGKNNTITIVAAYNDTVVSIHLPFLAQGEEVFFEGRNYGGHEVITVTLAQRTSIHIRQNLDLTGTYIRASTPVAVFSGADDYLEQLFPTEYFGTVFVTPKLVTAFTTNLLRIVASEGNTICQIDHNAIYTTFHNMTFIGEKVDQIMSGSDNKYTISCKKAVQVVLFAQSSTNGGFMTNVVPRQQLKASYFFTTNMLQDNQHISVQRFGTNFWLRLLRDGGQIREDTINRYIDTSVNYGLSYMEFQTKHNNETYAVYVFSEGVPGSATSFAFGSLGGAKLKVLTTTCTPTSNTVNDEIDNDCDGLVNEEICVRNIYQFAPEVYISNEKYIPDFDVDGSLDEDCHMEIPVPSSSIELPSSIEPTPSSDFLSTHFIESFTMAIQPTSSINYLYDSITESTTIYASESTSLIQHLVSSSSSTQVTTTQASTSKMCGCPCSKTVVDPKYQNLTQEKIEKIVEEIKKELTVEKGNLSSSIRKKTSAKDDRPSSTGIGSVGIVFFVIVFGGLILSDVTALYQHLKILKDNLCGFRRSN